MASYILSDPSFSDGARPEAIEAIMNQLRGRDGVKFIGYEPDSEKNIQGQAPLVMENHRKRPD